MRYDNEFISINEQTQANIKEITRRRAFDIPSRKIITDIDWVEI